MRRFLRRAIPSMFQRRLLLLVVCGCAAVGALAGQTAMLTIGPGHVQRQEQAQLPLSVPDLIPTVRGRILDSKGRVLAVDKPAWAIAVNYDVIVGDWAYEHGKDAAIDAAGEHWKEMDETDRREAIAQARQPFDAQVNAMWNKLTALARLTRPNFARSDIEKKKNAIAQRVQRVTSHLWSIWREQREAEVKQPVPLSNVSKPVAEQTQPHVILNDISDHTLATVRELMARSKSDPAYAVWSQVHLQRPEQRRYPFKSMTVVQDRSTLPLTLQNPKPVNITVHGVAIHIIGQMRDVWRQDMVGKNARPFTKQDRGGYLPGDMRGSFGIEAAQEDHLRGIRGKVVRHLDTGKEDRIEPIPGKDVHLTIDIQLEAQVQAIMSPAIGLLTRQVWNPKSKTDPEIGQPMTGAAVVMRVKDSAVLASVSMPPMSLEVLKEHPDEIYNNPVTKAYLNRVVAAQYPPGSTVKPLLFAAAVTAGVFPLNGTLECNGYLYPDNPHAFRCWIYKEYGQTHGILTGPQAIEQSCDVFFYKIGRKMGVKRLVDWYTQYGYNRVPASGLPGAISGSLPSPTDKRINDAIFMGIGQGPIACTPLQVAAAYATLARGGIYMAPTYVEDQDRFDPRKKVNLHLDPQAVQAAIKGMYMVTHGEKGTGRWLHYHGHFPLFNVKGVTIYGKSGTADPGQRWIDKNMNGKVDKGEVDLHPDDDAWFVTLVKPDGAAKPTFVVLAMVPYGGSGSQVAAPIVNQIIHALKAEGYLS